MSLKPISSRVAYEGTIIRVIETLMSDGRIFEKAVRSPGTRNIIHNTATGEILLMKEYRAEIQEYDLRLPGGKVKDKILQWDRVQKSNIIEETIITAAKKEMKEEVGIEAQDTRIFTVSSSGGPTVEWTLYYCVTTQFIQLPSQSLEAGEYIVPTWVSTQNAQLACLEGKLKEGRSVAALLQYLHAIQKI